MRREGETERERRYCGIEKEREIYIKTKLWAEWGGGVRRERESDREKTKLRKKVRQRIGQNEERGQSGRQRERERRPRSEK